VDGALTGIAPIRPLQLCADGGYQLRLGALGVPLITVPDTYLSKIKLCVYHCMCDVYRLWVKLMIDELCMYVNLVCVTIPMI
jgi:hypothetical protein